MVKKKTTKSRKVEKKIKTEPARPTRPAPARLVYLRMHNGDEIVTLMSTLKEYYAELLFDVETKEKDPKIKKKLVDAISAKDELEFDMSHMKVNSMDDVFVMYYPTRVSYINSPTKGPALFLQPWISTSITVRQVFRFDKGTILAIAEPEDGLKEYYTATMRKMMMAAAFAMHQKAELMIDPNSPMGKVMAGLKGQNAHSKEAEDQDDEYVADMIAKSRQKPAPEQTGEIKGHENTSSANVLPSIIYAGDKKTLH